MRLRKILTMLAVSTAAMGMTACGSDRDQRCREYDNEWRVCAPMRSPDGGVLLRLWEDGSAGYADGWGIDPDGPDGQGTPAWVRPGVSWNVA